MTLLVYAPDPWFAHWLNWWMGGCYAALMAERLHHPGSPNTQGQMFRVSIFSDFFREGLSHLSFYTRPFWIRWCMTSFVIFLTLWIQGCGVLDRLVYRAANIPFTALAESEARSLARGKELSLCVLLSMPRQSNTSATHASVHGWLGVCGLGSYTLISDFPWGEEINRARTTRLD